MFIGTFLLFTEIPRKWRRGIQEEREDQEEDGSFESKSDLELLTSIRDVLHKDPSKVDFSKIDEDEKEKLSRIKPNFKGVIV
jgi:hypothetical protein